MSDDYEIGKIGWLDMTVEDAADLPPGWLIYIMVADVEDSARIAVERGGKLLVEPRGLAGGRFCVIEDPGGSIAGLYQAKAE